MWLYGGSRACGKANPFLKRSNQHQRQPKTRTWLALVKKGIQDTLMSRQRRFITIVKVVCYGQRRQLTCPPLLNVAQTILGSFTLPLLSLLCHVRSIHHAVHSVNLLQIHLLFSSGAKIGHKTHTKHLDACNWAHMHETHGHTCKCSLYIAPHVPKDFSSFQTMSSSWKALQMGFN